MNSRLTVLNISALVYLSGCLVYTLINYSTLSGGEGWGMAYMIVLFLLGLSALVVDFLIRKIFKQRKTRQIISAIATVIYLIVIYLGM